MVRLRRPSDAEIGALLRAGTEPLSYPEVGATADLGAPLHESLAATYDLDQRRFPLGRGRDCFERSRAALMAWRQFEIPWLELHGASAPVRPGQVVATLVSVAGLWFLNPCRVVFAQPPPAESDVAAFAYGTLAGHVESGEERFVVSIDPDTNEVHYEVAAFSCPASRLTRLGYPLARRIQRRFAIASAEALARAVA